MHDGLKGYAENETLGYIIQIIKSQKKTGVKR